jgi:hypothetical protein
VVGALAPSNTTLPSIGGRRRPAPGSIPAPRRCLCRLPRRRCTAATGSRRPAAGCLSRCRSARSRPSRR